MFDNMLEIGGNITEINITTPTTKPIGFVHLHLHDVIMYFLKSQTFVD